MDRSAEQIKSEIEALKAELVAISPASGLSVRQIALRAGVSPGTAHRFKEGRTLDMRTTKAFIEAGFITKCPACGADLTEKEGS